MSRKMTHVIQLAWMLCLIGNATVASAVTLVWVGGQEGNAWGIAENWDPAQVPGADDTVVIETQPGLGPIIDETHVGANAAICTVVEGSNNSLDVTGGNFTILVDWNVGKQGSPLVNVSGGTVDIGDDLNIGPKAGEPTFDMTGGTINAAGSLIVARKSGAIATLNMHGGTINCDDVRIAPQDNDTVGVINLYYGTINTDAIAIATEGGSGLLNVRAGTLIISGDAKATVDAFIGNGLVAAYGGDGMLHLDYDVTNSGRTTLTATHLLNPNPADGSTGNVGISQLQWTLPGPNVPGAVVTCDVYFGTDLDLLFDSKVVANKTVESVSVTVAPQTVYYWAVDPYDSSVSATEPIYLGPLFKFDTVNLAPAVSAGDDIETWLAGGPRVVQLDGIVSDEDGGPAIVLWTVIAEPGGLNPAQISDASVANPTVTLTEPGTYTLQIEAGDSQFTVTDTKQIIVYADACEHASNQEGFEWIPGDINHDCIVDDLDLAILEEHWLQWNFSTE